MHIGQPVRRFQLCMPDDLAMRLAQQAGAEQRTKTAIVIEAIERYIAMMDKNPITGTEPINGQPEPDSIPDSYTSNQLRKMGMSEERIQQLLQNGQIAE